MKSFSTSTFFGKKRRNNWYKNDCSYGIEIDTHKRMNPNKHRILFRRYYGAKNIPRAWEEGIANMTLPDSSDDL